VYLKFSRGCQQHCPFCTDPVLRGGLAVDPVQRTLGTLRALAAGRDPVQWSAYAYPHDIDAALAARMARAGCRALFLGIESLAPGVRVGKHHAKDPGEIARAVDLLHEHGIFVHGNFIIGLPGETEDTVGQTLDGVARIGFDSVGGGPFYLTPGSTFDRIPHRFGIRILDPDWRVRQHVNFYDPGHEYFATATLTQPRMKALAGEFRRQVEDARLACWNLSDYALLCWLSAGGEKTDAAVPDDAASFVSVTRELAAGSAPEAGGQ
jgi:coproporphyrinogen III oxidase-like Fe-S oxidoreductase